MNRMMLGFFLIFSALNVPAQTINVRGTITNEDEQPISGAVVRLMAAGLETTTGNDGSYAIESNSSAIGSLPLGGGSVLLKNGILEIRMQNSGPISIAVFDIKSVLLEKKVKKAAAGERYRWNLAQDFPGNQLLLVKTQVGSESASFRYMPLGSFPAVTANRQGSLSGRSLARAAAAADSLEISAAGYFSKTLDVENLDSEINAILHDDNGKPTPPATSEGCGKPLGNLASAYRTITSSGETRDYYLDIPEDYNPNHPYRIFFTFHYGGGNMTVMVDGIVEFAPGTGPEYAFYGLKHQANIDGDPAIVIAPDGINGGWTEKAHPLFDDLLAFAKENLCVDSTRVFSTGFSFGGMITYSLSSNHQKDLRAVVGLGPANYNIWLPEKTHEPIGYMSSTGMDDNTTPWDRGNGTDGAKYALLEKAEDNGCDIPNNIPTTTSGSRTHLCYDFEGCMEGYPVKACTFDGGHIANVGDGGTGNVGADSWVVHESYDFFDQF